MRKIVIFISSIILIGAQQTQGVLSKNVNNDYTNLNIAKSFDMRGIQAGKHTLKWNATNDLGEKVGTGVYLYQLQTKDFMKTRKMIFMK